ncbi:MAG: beta-lactamase family protein [Defluviitaleaceae bacterium]|nr:beta-lactamase family protein [Defluviitaleaceae bacterium]
MKQKISKIFEEWLVDDGDGFWGVFSVANADGIIYERALGYRDRTKEIENQMNTAFGVASGTKLFTGLSVCKLIDEGKLSLDDKIWDVLGKDLGQVDKTVTIRHLLTHTSGIGDYVDEDWDDFDAEMEKLREKFPVHLWTNLDYYLPMTTPLPPKFAPGERYGYSNSGFILLGLAVEAIGGISYQDYVQKHIIETLGMTHTGFYRMDALPENTAISYMVDDEGEFTPNTDIMPIIGGSDGGIFTTVADLDRLWRGIFNHKILSADMTENFLKAHVTIDEEDGESYGLGVFRVDVDGKVLHYGMGFDSGVRLATAYHPKTGTTISAISNNEVWPFDLISESFETLE